MSRCPKPIKWEALVYGAGPDNADLAVWRLSPTLKIWAWRAKGARRKSKVASGTCRTAGAAMRTAERALRRLLKHEASQ